jgi:NAD(P)-dependent dehydrogenase (short-subunit alcohol dehydrogenase family)
VKALVIGASGAIGSAPAHEFSLRGYDVHGTYCTHKGPYVDYKLDIMDPNDPTYKFIISESWDVMVTCAGALQQKSWDTITMDDWMYMLNVNLIGTYTCIRAALSSMLARGSGSIITVASVGGQNGGTLGLHYAAAKAGVISLTKSFARIAAPNVRVNCVAPGIVDTPMTKEELSSEAGLAKVAGLPLQRPAYPCEIAKVIVDVSEASYMIGAVVNVNGGQYI